MRSVITAVLTTSDGYDVMRRAIVHKNARPAFLGVVIIAAGSGDTAVRGSVERDIPHYFFADCSESRLCEIMKLHRVELVCLYRWPFQVDMILAQQKERILDAYESLLPAFKGYDDPLKSALDYPVKVTGVTIYRHRQTQIVAQEEIHILPGTTIETLRGRAEHETVYAYRAAIKDTALDLQESEL